MARPPISGQDTETFILGGGLDLSTPALALSAGKCISCSNYEAEVRGYRRLTGYERFDGRPKPSDAEYTWITFEDGSYPIADGPFIGDSIRGATSGVQGDLLLDVEIDSGSFLAGTAAGDFAVTSPATDFTDGETLEISPSPITVGGEIVTVGGDILFSTEWSTFAAVVTSVPEGAPTDELGAEADEAAAETARALILAVPGSGPVRGVWGYAGAIWAFRDNAGATAGRMWKATAAGWVEQTFGHTLDFDGGTGAAPGLVAGQAINGQSSGATATIQRVVQQSGDWGTDAAGYLVLSGVTGTFQNNENIRVGSTVYALANGTQAAITLPAGGKYAFVNHNFYGTSNLRRMYFANGVGYAHEWDGTVLAPIRRGMSSALDKPTRIGVLANHLFQAYAGGAVLFSEIGEPLGSRTDSGAGEVGFGADVTDLLDSASTALLVFGTGKIGYITGTDADSFQLQIITDEAGAQAWTAQNAQYATYLDQIGIRRVQASDKFGNWMTGTLTPQIQPFFDSQRRRSVLPVCSMRVRSKDQYRLFYDDGTGVVVYLGRKYPEPMLFTLLVEPYCACSTDEGPAGVEELFIGGEDGFVYQVDSGPSFDGEEVVAALRLPFNSIKSPSVNKRYHKATLEVDASASTRIFLNAEFAYSDADVPPASEQEFSVRGGGGFWDEANWDEFFWSAPAQGLAEAHIDGIGQNVSIAVLSEATYEDPHTLTAMTLNFSYRRQIR